MGKGIANILIVVVLGCVGFIHISHSSAHAQRGEEDRQQYLEQLQEVLLPDQQRNVNALPPTPVDSTWTAWVERTGELPPDFDEMPSLPFLPDPLVLDEGDEHIPVETISQWRKKRQWIKEQAQRWITGTVPPPPDNLTAELLDERQIGELTEQDLLLRFGPDHEAELRITLLIPPGEGPFPVFMCPWKEDRYDWVQAAVRRGYIGVRFAATDPKYGLSDDSEAYADIWWPDYDFTTIMRWAWSASRTIDYLHTLPHVNRDQIALTGLSRNGKSALWSAAYDDRIKAVVPISGGTGGEHPFRYTSAKYNNESIELLTRVRPHWLHPRLRFFVGREHKLPVDQNSLMALVAPRGLMLTSSINEHAADPWGIEQAYRSAKSVYEFLGAEENIAIDLREGFHAPASRDMERYLDFFDYVFERGNTEPQNKLYYDYTFSKWLGLSGEMINPLDYPSKGIDDILEGPGREQIDNTKGWEKKREEIRSRISWGLGTEPPSLSPGPQPDYKRDVLGLPGVDESVGSRPISFGRLYYPADGEGAPVDNDLPVMVFLHEYTYSTGFLRSGDLINRFTDRGFAVYVFDQIGFGTRIEEGRLFYERFPRWSRMGRMVADVRWAVDELAAVDYLDHDNLFVGGYALGGTVGLYSAALDDRIAGVISVAGFTPMRTDYPGKTAEGIYRYSHLHGLLPRLGFFVGNEDRIPYDYHEILASIAPRPVLITAPTWDQYNSSEDVTRAVDEAAEVYQLFGAGGALRLEKPEDYNRLSPEMKEDMVDWAAEMIE
ncbi:alpha/beta hydrolase family protein [Fodinibius sp.]|uniref:alpha/beta hydrolase family protein n=1 Tax=Fodinibius sp. TaxID=1872440 RepID=UPI003566B7C3